MKKTLASFLALLTVLSLLLAACNNRDDAADTTVSGDGTTLPFDATTPAPDGTTVAGGTEPPSVDEPVLPVPDGTLLYYENFDAYGLSSDSAATLSALGWKIHGTADGAYSNNTATYSIADCNGSRQLYIENYTDTLTGKDSYVTVLSDKKFGFYHNENYTLQYDLEYTTASNAARYIVMVTDYNGAFYNSFHFRNGGYGNNQCHAQGTWYSYEVAGENYAADNAKDSKYTIAYKLLGKYYDGTSLFSGVSVSVRVVMDWQKGNSVYMRVNDKTSYSGGEWVPVSRFSGSGSGVDYYGSDISGAALALKVGAAQNGYVDNIMLWKGTGDEPADKSSPKLGSKTTVCHSFVTVDGTKVCEYCGRTEEQIATSWLLDGVPAYDGGTPSEAVYGTGQGFDLGFPLDLESPMQIISGTSEAEFRAYVEKLKTAGYTVDYTAARDGNSYASLISSEKRLYTYYTAATGEVRVIDDRVSDCSATDFGYSYTASAGETTTVYQYGVPMTESATDSGKINYGMIYVIKLADNSVMIMDGGGYQQFDEAQIDGLMTFLENITGAGKTGKIRIAGWYISHGHQDHMAGFCMFAKKYSSRLTLERVFFNIPSPYSTDSKIAGLKSVYTNLTEYIDNYFSADKPEYLKIHTGQQIHLADITIDVLYTHEDLVDKTSAVTLINADYNNSCSVIKITYSGKTFMFLGDINRPAMEKLTKTCSDTTLKADMVQMAHHVLNNLSELYHKIKATTVLVPQSRYGTTRTNGIAAMNAVKTYADENNIYYASEQTAGFTVVNGAVKLTYTEPVHGGPNNGNSW